MQGDLEGLTFDFRLKKMEKKEYIKPAMRQIEIHHHNHLLIGSNDPTKKMEIYEDTMDNEDDVM